MDIVPLEEARIVVLCGGPGVERAISLESGACVAEGLAAAGLRVECRVVSGDPDEIAGLEADLVFPVLHGEFGEDGTVQRLLEERGLPYAGCDPAVSALAMDKQAAKNVFASNGIPTPSGIAVCQVAEAPERVAAAGLVYPLVVKPNSRGSSVGVRIVRDPEDLREAVAEALAIDTTALAETFLAGRELTVGLLGADVLPVVELRTGREFFDFEAKYRSETTEYICPALLEDADAETLCATASAAGRALGVRDFARVDILLSAGVAYVLEVNTIPGMTSHSLLPKAACAAGYSFAQLCRRMVEPGWQRAVTAGKTLKQAAGKTQ